jgi:hypothetical protein
MHVACTSELVQRRLAGRWASVLDSRRSTPAI